MNEIRTLSDQTISQIAAGEIVENPASIIKELVENALDAEATHISIRISENILDEIRVSDDGVGIDKTQVPRAFSRHATSKLRNISDLGYITSLGFRGEALASIASISKMECITKTKEDDYAYKFLVEGSNVSDGIIVGAPQGTTMIIRDIFYNTPVRKNFLGAKNKEIREITKIVELLALSRQDVSFHLIHGKKTLLQSHLQEKKRNHIYSILGREIAKNLIPIVFDTESFKIEGYISNNLLHRSAPEKEFIFINGRGVKSEEISSAMRKAYRSLIPLHHYPVFVLYITIDPVLIDVNIHPQKQTVRLSNHNQLTTVLERLVFSALNPERKIPTVEDFHEQKNTSKTLAEEIVPDKNIFELSQMQKNESENTVEERVRNLDSDDLASDENIHFGIENKEKCHFAPKKETNLREEVFFQEDRGSLLEKSPIDDNRHKPALDIQFYEYLAIVFKTYILFENKKDHRLLIVDQHAAHERILYEKYSKDIKNSAVATQLLLEPIYIHLSAEEMQLVKEHISDYRLLGIEPEAFGENDVVIREVPEHILIPDFKQFFIDSIHSLEQGVNVKEQNIYKIMRMACRSAIKGGDRISSMEAYDLLKQLNKTQTPYTCPHGRPTMIHLEKRSFEKLFLREGI